MGQIDYNVSSHIATIVINNPEMRNAVDKEMQPQLVDAYADVIANEDVRVLVITGAGDKAFCSGASISGYLAEGVLGENAVQQRSPLPKPWRIYKPSSPPSRATPSAAGLALRSRVTCGSCPRRQRWGRRVSSGAW